MRIAVSFLCVFIMMWNLNDPPQVRIVSPENNSFFSWGSLVRYHIDVTDKEDGKSEYNEITASEVFLTIKYLADSAKSKVYIKDEASKNDHAGLNSIKRSGCFNCHSKKSKLIGPSFEDLAEKYSDDAGLIKTLANKIMKGSEGVWGTEKMPAFPQFDEKQASEMIRWIMCVGADKSVDIIPGVEGGFQTIDKPEGDNGKGVYVLTAAYTDHGKEDSLGQEKEGRHSVILRSR